jgi:hypothetical protein
MGEDAQLVEGVVVQRAPGQVVGHGFTPIIDGSGIEASVYTRSRVCE